MRLIDADELRTIKSIQSADFNSIESIQRWIDNAETYNQVGDKMATAEGFCTNPEWYKGGLISRSALLKTFSNSRRFKETTSGLYVMEMLAIKEVIDNAPTVPNEYMRGYEAAEREYKRPQGEWIEKVERRGCFAGDKTVYSYTCPFCGVKEFKKYPFCHCGADLRKGGAEE